MDHGHLNKQLHRYGFSNVAMYRVCDNIDEDVIYICLLMVKRHKRFEDIREISEELGLAFARSTGLFRTLQSAVCTMSFQT